jgi:hypothetical protein
MAGAFGKGRRLRSGQGPIGSSLLGLIHLSDEAQPRTPTNATLSVAAGDPDIRGDRLCAAATARVQAGSGQSGRAASERRFLRSDGRRHPVRHASLVLGSPAAHSDSISAFEPVPQSRVSVFGPAQLYFWQRVILRRCFQACSGAGPRYRLPSVGPARIPVRGMPFRVVLHPP